jgi:hypothetical protein
VEDELHELKDRLAELTAAVDALLERQHPGDATAGDPPPDA